MTACDIVLNDIIGYSDVIEYHFLDQPVQAFTEAKSMSMVYPEVLVNKVLDEAPILELFLRCIHCAINRVLQDHKRLWIDHSFL